MSDTELATSVTRKMTEHGECPRGGRGEPHEQNGQKDLIVRVTFEQNFIQKEATADSKAMRLYQCCLVQDTDTSLEFD
jgi:hypothetical protein